MARKTVQLTTTQLNNAKPKEKEYNLSDGQGLMLRIKPNGSKLWLFNYTRPYSKKRANLSFGAYPSISLAAARKLKDEARELLAHNIDPQHKKKEKEAEMVLKEASTLESITRQWFELKRNKITESYAEDIIRSLENHVFPKLGNYPISKITAPIAIECLTPLAKSDRLEMVKRVSQRLNDIMTYATNVGLIESNPLTGIRHAFSNPTVKHNPTLKPHELPELIATIKEANIRMLTRYLLEWQLHTMTRPSEAAGARWDEIDANKKLWIIPPERMKKRREHIIPLTAQTLELLAKIRQITISNEYIFPSNKDPKRCANSSTANVALKRMGFQGRLTAHGMRALASTILNEQGFDPDVIEAALAHTDKDKVRAVYNRASYVERRRKMMEWWSSVIEDAGSLKNIFPNNTRSLKVVNEQ